MELNQNLKKELPASLRDKVSTVVTPDEPILVSLPGSFGEALVVTQRRVMIVREKLSSMGSEDCIDSYIYPFMLISGVDVVTSNTGGSLVVSGDNMPQEIEKHAVFFPTYDLDKFNCAKDAILKMLQKEQSRASVQTAVDGGNAVSGDKSSRTCGQCGTEVREYALFCSKCGANLGYTCEVCSGVIRADDAYCSSCGAAAVPNEGMCQGCGRVLPGSHYTYCPWCGIRRKNLCFACGAGVSKSWVHCANCGRKLGSEEMDSAAMRNIYARRTMQPEVSANEQIATPPQSEPTVVGPISQDKTVSELAAEHNERGKSLFEQDNVEGAIEAFKTAVDLDPSNSVYHCNLAVAYDDNDQDEEALAAYERTLELNPNDTTALLYVGYMYSENDQPEDAAKAWKRLIEVAPGTAEADEAAGNLRHQGEL